MFLRAFFQLEVVIFVTVNLCTWQGWTNVSTFDFATLYLAFLLEKDSFLILFNFAIAASDYHNIVFNKILKIPPLLTDILYQDITAQISYATIQILTLYTLT